MQQRPEDTIREVLEQAENVDKFIELGEKGIKLGFLAASFFTGMETNSKLTRAEKLKMAYYFAHGLAQGFQSQDGPIV